MLSVRRVISVNSRNSRCVSDFVKVVEVGARDGLQNEKKILPSSAKIELINRLSKTGLRTIEVTSFVSPKWIPQMRDNSEVFRGIHKEPGVDYPVLVPNAKGMEAALNAGAREIAIFGAASEAFSQKNTNCSIAESVERFTSVIKLARDNGVKVRGYVSCIVGCPYEGDVQPLVVARLSAAMLELGCYEISLGDTVGVGTPKKIARVLRELKSISSAGNMSEFAVHCHNTYGQALANVYASLENDVRTFDSSVGGLGGCPYAAGASGNVATEDLLYLLQGQGLESGVDLNEMVAIGSWISEQLARENQSKVGVAMMARQKTNKRSD